MDWEGDGECKFLFFPLFDVFFNPAFCCKDWKRKSHLVNIGRVR